MNVQNVYVCNQTSTYVNMPKACIMYLRDISFVQSFAVFEE
jgi:hypothetical protein